MDEWKDGEPKLRERTQALLAVILVQSTSPNSKVGVGVFSKRRGFLFLSNALNNVSKSLSDFY
jgi:hypothetical protein